MLHCETTTLLLRSLAHIVSRPLEGVPPTIDLVIGYSNANTSPILKLFLSRADDLVARVSQKVR
jgi:LysR family transcriptional regulator, hca operon transcriptional activator